MLDIYICEDNKKQLSLFTGYIRDALLIENLDMQIVLASSDPDEILEGMKADSVSQEECDVVVPRARIAEYVKAAKRIALSYGIRVEPCGHCGDGNIHTEMLRGPEMSDEEWKSATHACLKELYALSKELGGQLSGEHGIGNGRLEFLEEFVGPRMIELYKAIKLAFDEKLILNPGKVIEFQKGN